MVRKALALAACNKKPGRGAAAQMNGAHAMTLEASWQGSCPAGMKVNMMQLPTR